VTAARRPGPPWSVDAARDAIGGIALATAAFQMVLFGIKRIPIEPQYYFGTFPTHVVLAWLAVEALGRVRLGTVAVAVYGLSAAAVTLGSIWFFDVRPRVTGAPGTPRPEVVPLAVQVDAARLLNRYADAEVWTDVAFYHRHPQALRALRLLVSPDPAAGRPEHGRLVLTFAGGRPARREADDGQPAAQGLAPAGAGEAGAGDAAGDATRRTADDVADTLRQRRVSLGWHGHVPMPVLSSCRGYGHGYLPVRPEGAFRPLRGPSLGSSGSLGM
jgi:hypothetical protein